MLISRSSQFDSLPYLDEPLSEHEVAQARRVIEQEAGAVSDQPHHPLVPQETASFLTPELNQLMANGGVMEKGIDTERYTNLHDEEGSLRMDRAYIALAYQQSRLENLELLTKYGKNQWLVGNDQLDQRVKQVESQVLQEQQTVERINHERQTQQEQVRTTLDYLTSRWKQSLKNVVDVNVACAKLQQ